VPKKETPAVVRKHWQAMSKLFNGDVIYMKLLPLILEKAAAIRPADPLDPAATFGAIMNEAHMEKVLAYIETGSREGELILGGKRVYPPKKPQ
jgi:acyl-CoA reductase-like NAD-dependent aldehyde dehydrogenase